MPTEKQKLLFNEFYDTLPENDEKIIFTDIINCLMEFGYAPVKCKTSKKIDWFSQLYNFYIFIYIKNHTYNNATH